MILGFLGTMLRRCGRRRVLINKTCYALANPENPQFARPVLSVGYRPTAACRDYRIPAIILEICCATVGCGRYTPMKPSTAMPQQMQAFVLKAYGGPEFAALEEVPVPQPSARQMLVRVRDSGLNPVDFKTRRGDLRLVQRYRLPAVLGNELAGEVITCGEQVRRFCVGDRVFARVAKERM